MTVFFRIALGFFCFPVFLPGGINRDPSAGPVFVELSDHENDPVNVAPAQEGVVATRRAELNRVLNR